MDAITLFRALRQHRQGASRAPHKPLVLLWTLARLLRGEERLARWSRLQLDVSDLLREFGRPGQNTSPVYPFWRLRGDGLWEVEQADRFVENASGDVRVSELNERDPAAGLTPEVWQELREHPALAHQAVQILLDDNFPPSLHEDLLLAVGMPTTDSVSEAAPEYEEVTTKRRKRDPAFRAEVLRIYRYRCAICGYEGRLEGVTLGVDAAHVQWHANEGPDAPENGLALCAFHHRIFDKGAIGLDDDRNIMVSQHVHGAGPVDRWIYDYQGAPLHGPQPGTPVVGLEHLRWHRREVFRRPPRPT